MLVTSDGFPHKGIIYAFWPGVTPAEGSCISTTALVAFDDSSDTISLGTSNTESEVMPGSVKDPECAERYIMTTALRFRGRGEVTRAAASDFTVSGTSYNHMNGVVPISYCQTLCG
ncbi:hypothetical protein CF319_g5537 [Tilletia indica]|nr:hypothetical protein CF319_g5537 [Tilletia indica]